MKPQSQNRVTMVFQLRRKARPTIARLPVTSTLLTKNNGRRPILFFGRHKRSGGRAGRGMGKSGQVCTKYLNGWINASDAAV